MIKNSSKLNTIYEAEFKKFSNTFEGMGSHQSGKYINKELKNVKIIKAKAGDVLFLDRRTWHGTKENKTKKSRWSI